MNDVWEPIATAGNPADEADVDIWAAVDERIDDSKWKPRMASGFETAEFETAGGGRHVMVASPDRNVHYRLNVTEASILDSLDGTRTIADLVVERLERGGRLDAEAVIRLVRMLETGGFLDTRRADVVAALDRALHRPTWRSRLRRFASTLTVEWSGAHRLVEFLYNRLLRPAFGRVGAVLLALLTVLGVVAFVTTTRTHQFALTNRRFGVAFVVLMGLDLAVVFIHELGHAAMLVHYGRRVKSAGFRIYFGTPSFFIESSDGLMLSTRRRILQSAAGPGFEMAWTSVAAIALWAFPGGLLGHTLYQFVVINCFVLFLNLVPLLELDGYWILSDALHQPDLRPESLAFIRRGLWSKVARRQRLTRREVGLAAYGIAGVMFTIAAVASAWFFWRRVFGDTVRAMWHAGFGGRALLVMLVLVLAGPALRGALDSIRSLGRIALARLHRIRFRFETRWRIEAAELLDASGTFGDLPVESLNDLAGRVKLQTFGRGQAVIRQGDPAEAYYLVRSGQFDVIEEGADGEQRQLRTLLRGEGFGDYGLLEGAARTATVRAIRRSEAFEVDKACFDRLLAGRATRPSFAPTRQQLNELEALAPFSNLGAENVARVAHRGTWVNVAPGETLFHQGEPGDSFYVIGSGRLSIEVNGQTVRSRAAGEHVGEMALLLDAPRNATVRAATPARLFRLDRSGFDALIAAQFHEGALHPNIQVERHGDH